MRTEYYISLLYWFTPCFRTYMHTLVRTHAHTERQSGVQIVSNSSFIYVLSAFQICGKLSCSLCGKECTTKWNLKTHEDWHKGKGYYPCKYCGKTFMATSSLQGHMSIHTGIKEFKCLICGREFGWKGDLKKHLNNVHHWNLPRERRSSRRRSGVHGEMAKGTNASHTPGS